MKALVLQLLLLTLLVACTKGDEQTIPDSRVTACPQIPVLDSPPTLTLCTTDTCLYYQQIWKELFLERNNLSDEFFNAHITLNSSRVSEWDGGISFQIIYSVTMGWSVARVNDQFIVWIDPEYSAGGTKGVALTKSEINTFLENRMLSSYMNKLSSDGILFPSQEDAWNQLILRSDVNMFCNPSFALDRQTGHILLQGNATFVNQSNKCIFASIDLSTGDVVHADDACFLSGNHTN